MESSDRIMTICHLKLKCTIRLYCRIDQKLSKERTDHLCLINPWGGASQSSVGACSPQIWGPFKSSLDPNSSLDLKRFEAQNVIKTLHCFIILIYF